MEQKARRGRPRGFDLDEAVQAAQRVFWKHGLAATSLDQLSATMGLHKPSVYAAFGGKHALYISALDAYLALASELTRAALDRPRLSDAFEAFFAADLDLFLADDGRGCFMLSTATTVAGIHPDVAERVTAANTGLRKLVERRLQRAVEAGELRTSNAAEALAEIIVSTHMALSIRARSGEDRTALEASVRCVLAFLGVSQRHRERIPQMNERPVQDDPPPL
jgi:AcrR family transcriptional regulator